jgi:glutamyl-tRNA synthetase/nondiscriminating glutamyl-tRNA synthetase
LPEGREDAALEVIREEARVLSDAPRLLREVVGPVYPAAFADELPESSVEVFDHVAASLHGRKLRDVEAAQGFVGELRGWSKERGIKTRDLLHPLRLALTGQNRGPEISLVFAALGPEEARGRIERAREARLGP